MKIREGQQWADSMRRDGTEAIDATLSVYCGAWRHEGAGLWYLGQPTNNKRGAELLGRRVVRGEGLAALSGRREVTDDEMNALLDAGHAYRLVGTHHTPAEGREKASK